MQHLTTIDDFIAYQAGTHIIKLTWTNHDVYNVTVYNGEDRLHDLGGTYPTETEARLIARGYAQMFLAEAQLVADINTTMDAAEAPYRTERENLATIAADVDTGSWHAERRRARKQAAKQANRPDFSKTRVHRKPPTTAELDRIRSHRDGVVTLLPGQPWTLLQAIETRGYGVGVRENPSRPKLAYVRLNARGLAVAGQQGSVAA